MGSIRKLVVGGALVAGLAFGIVWGPDGTARGGMSSSALTGVIYSYENPANLIVSFKVIDSTNGDVVWQSNPNEIVLTQSGAQLTYDIEVDESFRPDDPKYEWVMVVNAVRADQAVYWTSFVFNDIFDVDHVAPDVPGLQDIQRRIVEAHVTIED